MDIKGFCKKSVMILEPEQRERFIKFMPGKVYHTERNISVLVAAMQAFMIVLFLQNSHMTFTNPRAVGYFVLYASLLAVTVITLFLYRYMVRGKHYKGFLRLRRSYALLLCVWVVGISFLEQMKGNGLSVYSYLLPTTAALLLFNPLESTAIFGSTWVGLAVILMNFGNRESMFGDMVNSLFVTVLALFISFRYYRSTAIEFRDRETIAVQYEEIKSRNNLLGELAHVDQLTGLYNRHFLHQTVYPHFESCKEQDYYGMSLMMDIDYFKQYNDKYGHLQGDECLRQIAECVKKLCEAQDAYAIRYGGEEFLIIKVSKQDFDGCALAEDLFSIIKQAQIPREDVEQKRVTVSAGLWCGSLCDVPDIETAIQCADDALYSAKSLGRDRTVQGHLKNEKK